MGNETTGHVEVVRHIEPTPHSVTMENTSIQEKSPSRQEASSSHITEQHSTPVIQAVVEQRPAPTQVDVVAAIAASGLVQIETDASKRAAVAAPQVESTPPVSRRRSRPREVYSMENSEPLVQIETHTPN